MRYAMLLIAALALAGGCRSSEQKEKSNQDLMRELSNEDPEVRKAAAREFGQRGWEGRYAYDKLNRMARTDPDEGVRKVAKRAVERIDNAAEMQAKRQY